MSSLKQLRLAEKAVREQRQVVADLNALVKDIDRCEKTISSLKDELQQVNAKFQAPRTTREDVAYLSELLQCAKKKLAWEKQMASLSTRAPQLLDTLMRLIDDPLSPPSDQMRQEMMRALQAMQGAMEKLNQVKIS